MGKAASPAKKNSAHCGGRESSSRSIAFDGPESGGGTLMVVPRVESTIASRETATHLAFAKSRKDDFVYAPTSHYLRVLNDHCQWDRDARSAVLVVVGQPGTGKSALLANWAEQRRRSERGARELIYEHYSGCSYDSVKLSLFLFRFMHQLKISYNLRDFELPREHEEEKLKFSFSRCLDAAVGKEEHSTGPASKRKRIVLVLDGIDCVRTEDGGDSLSWLPNTFPAGVRIIVSTTQTSAKGKSQLRCCSSVVRQPAVYDNDGDPIYATTLPPCAQESHTIRELRRRNAAFVVAEPLDEASCLAILDLYEEKRSRELDPEEKRLILAARGSSNPLYVRLLLNALELFEPNQSEQRRRWLERACESNQLNVIYELLMKQWNAMLLEDLVLELNDRRASLDASSSNNGVIPSSVSNGSALDRKAGDVATLQIAIEQRALLVRHTLSLLSVTRYGLSENDFVRLFGDGVSRSICQQLLVLLRPHLMQIRRYDCGPSTHTATPSSSSNQGSKESDAIVLYDLSHNQLRLLARYGFLRDDQLRHCYYRELAVYFDAMDACQRRVDELPVQLERCAMWNVLQSVLVNMKMFQLWWSERNRQEFFSYWMVLSANCSVHDPVDDFIRSLDEFIAHEDPSAEQLLSLFLTITEFLRTWQKVDDSRASNLVLNRPSPPQLQEFISSLGNFSLANLSEDEAKRVQKEIEALCIHPSDGYYVRRWIWTQFPLIGIAFETRVFRSAAFGRSSGPGVDEEAASGSRGDSTGPETGGQAESSSQPQAMGNPNSLPKALNDKGAASKKAPRGNAGVVLPKGLSVAGEKASKPLVPGKRRPPHKTPPSLALESFAEGEIGALEFLSVESSEGSLGSVSKLESQLLELRTKFDRMKFVAREKSEALKALKSRVADARAEVAATGQSATQLDDLLESIRTVNDEALLGRQRSDYYKAILRHCELCPARDPNTIETAEAIASKLRREIVDLQQKTQVISYEKRLVGLDVPKLVQVTQDKAAIHQEALTRLRWRQELDRRLYYASLSAKDSGEGSNCQHSTKGSSTSPGRGAKKSVCVSTSDLVMGLPGAQSPTNEVSTADDSTNTPATDANFVRAKEKLLHMKETSLARQKNAESLQLYVGSAYKDDGVLGALRQVGINKPEEAMLYWQNQLDHSVQLEKEEKQAEQRVLEYREKVELLQAQFVNLKLSGSASARADVAPDGTAGANASADDEGAASSVGVNVKNLEQQLADATAAKNKKKERAGRLRALQEKLQLGLLHVAQLLGVASVQQLNAVELIDAIEKVVRLELGDEAHVQAAGNPSVRHKNSVRMVSIAGQLGDASALLSDVRSDEDKARYNIRVSRSERRQMNPYVEFEGEDEEDDEQEEDGDEEQEGADGNNGEHGDGGDGAEDQNCGEAAKRSGTASTRKDSNTVKKRRDIKNQSMLEFEKKRKAGQKKKSKE